LLLLLLLGGGLLASLFLRHVMTDGATHGRACNAMVPGQMAADAANKRALEAPGTGRAAR
jgi:hypothetical protein